MPSIEVASLDIAVCRICSGKSGYQVRDGRSVCDVCLGLAPGSPTPDGDFEVDPNLAEKKYVCPRCGVISEGTRIGQNVTEICPGCVRKRRTEGQLKTFAERKSMKKSGKVVPASDNASAPKMDSGAEYKIVIDLSAYSDVFLAIFRHAYEQERTVDAQVRWWLRRLAEGEAVSIFAEDRS